MKDYPDKMTVEQARAFQSAVLNIVSQIPHGRVTTYGAYRCVSGMAQSFKDGGADVKICA